MGQADSGNSAVVRTLIEYIREQDLKVGSRLPSIRELSQALGIGRNAIRDALLQAETMGLVTIHPRFGCFVQSPDYAPMMAVLDDTLEAALMQEDKNILHIIDARIEIETDAAAKAAARWRPEDMIALREAIEALQVGASDRAAYIAADEQFHIGIAKIAGNPVLQTFLRVLLVLLRPHRGTLAIGQDASERSQRTHEEIYRAIISGDSRAAEQAMQTHLANGRMQVVEAISSVPAAQQMSAAQTARKQEG